jgi:hypothetical protein
MTGGIGKIDPIEHCNGISGVVIQRLLWEKHPVQGFDFKVLREVQ